MLTSIIPAVFRLKKLVAKIFENKIVLRIIRKTNEKTQDNMDKTNQFEKILSTREGWTDDRVPSCLYPEVVVIPHGSISSISVSSDLLRPPKSGGYWACSECSLVDNITAYQIPLRSSSRKGNLKNRIWNRMTSLFLSCATKTQKIAMRTKSATSVRSVCVIARSGNVFVRYDTGSQNKLILRHLETV
ncbi:hypothetical protein KP79_PYT08653 [Mizuhopecten yessoensis]|uniref:Uncharacterized protein n=1 Tax=Mizuhopecten yessoensis TaxID=6573 RepID=A0A210R0A0_MIZYE|nr:hypothetical protein KP79_PYT08653 [Mizuhopecten yessoensis]